jgi:hypothetical protein
MPICSKKRLANAGRFFLNAKEEYYLAFVNFVRRVKNIYFS